MNQILKILLYLVIVLALTGCHSPNTEKSHANRNEPLDLIKILEKYYNAGDTSNYYKYRLEIDKQIVEHNDKKLNCYLSLFDGKRLFEEGNLEQSKQALTRQIEDSRNYGYYDLELTGLHFLGNIYFYQNDLNGALKYWKSAYSLINKYKLDDNAADLFSNIGIAYLRLGYAKTANDYFTKAKEIFDRKRIKNENYLINNLNIVASAINLNQFEEANNILNTVNPSFSKTVGFFYYINKSKIFSIKKDFKQFKLSIDSASYFLKFYPAYQNIYDEILVENYLNFNYYPGLENLTFTNNYNSLYLSLLYEEVRLKLNKKGEISIDSLNKLRKHFLAENDHITLNQLYKVLSIYYEKNLDQRKLIEILRLKEDNQELINNEKLETQFFDYKEFNNKKSLAFRNQLLEEQLKNNSEKLKSQRLILIVIILLSFILITITISIIASKQKRGILREKELKIAKLELQDLEKNKESLETEKRIQELKLKKTSELLLKTTSIRNQFNEMFKLINTSDDWLQIRLLFKKMKISLNEIFMSYDEFLIKSLLSDNILEKVALFEKRFPELEKDEIQMVALITNNYTSKEIANLLSKSEKYVEAKRTVIRKKLNIDSASSLKDYLSTFIE